jgi:protein-disulfide isomerase-like protein with CxxC motif
LARSAGVRSRGYSLPLQRRMTDFGADVAFGQVPAKLHEHYGITVPVSAVRSVTERHARAVREGTTLQQEQPQAAGEPRLIAELDGSMIPIVDTVARRRVRIDARPARCAGRKRAWRWCMPRDRSARCLAPP